MVGRTLPDSNVCQVGDSRQRSRIFADGSLDVIWFYNCSAPELDFGHDASARKSIRRRWSAIRETTATRFSLGCVQPPLTIREYRYEGELMRRKKKEWELPEEVRI